MTTSNRFVAFIALFLTMSLAMSLPLVAQTGTSAVRGTVSDPQGRLVADAQVTLTNQANGNVRTSKTTSNGGFNFDLITPGEYRLEIEERFQEADGQRRPGSYRKAFRDERSARNRRR